MDERWHQFYNWGNNCRLMALSYHQAFNIMEEMVDPTSEEFDAFGEGFYNGVGWEIVSISVS